MFTLCEMLGVPEADRPKIIEWMKFFRNGSIDSCHSSSSE